MNNASKSRVDDFVVNSYRQNANAYVDYRLGANPHLEDALIPLVKRAFSMYAPFRARVLDLGCGFDPVMGILRDQIEHYIGLDISAELITRHPLYGNPLAEFIQADVRRYSYKKISYDFVNGSLILNYVKHPHNLLTRVRRADAGFCFCLPNPAFDKRYGDLNGNCTLSLTVNQHSFVYYFHTIDAVKEALGPTQQLAIDYSLPVADGIPPVYVCFFGKW